MGERVFDKRLLWNGILYGNEFGVVVDEHNVRTPEEMLWPPHLMTERGNQYVDNDGRKLPFHICCLRCKDEGIWRKNMHNFQFIASLASHIQNKHDRDWNADAARMEQHNSGGSSQEPPARNRSRSPHHRTQMINAVRRFLDVIEEAADDLRDVLDPE